MNELEVKEEYSNQTFEDIKHVDEFGNEYWYARELQVVLDYKEWRKFENVISKAIKSCKNVGMSEVDHFGGAAKMVQLCSFSCNFN